MKENELQAKIVALKLRGVTRPLLLEFAGWLLEHELHDEDMLVSALTKKWDGKLTRDDADMRSFIYNLFEFALEKAKMQEKYDEGEEGPIHTELDTNCDDPSRVTLHHPDSKTLVYHQSFETYSFNPKYLEWILKNAGEGIRAAIGLIRRRMTEMKPFKCRECGVRLERIPDRCPMCGSERVGRV